MINKESQTVEYKQSWRNEYLKVIPLKKPIGRPKIFMKIHLLGSV